MHTYNKNRDTKYQTNSDNIVPKHDDRSYIILSFIYGMNVLIVPKILQIWPYYQQVTGIDTSKASTKVSKFKYNLQNATQFSVKFTLITQFVVKFQRKYSDIVPGSKDIPLVGLHYRVCTLQLSWALVFTEEAI